MKSIKTNLYLASAFICAILFFAACKKKDSTPHPIINNATAGNGTLYFHIHTNIHNTEADSGVAVYDSVINRQIKLTVAQFYISSIRLKKPDGTFFPLSGVYVLKTIGQEEYLLATVPSGTYTSVSFDVGIDSATNNKQPASFPPTSPLSQANMYNGGWFGGTFIFMNIQGYADTSVAQSGKFAPINYQTGTDPELEHVNMPAQNFIVTNNQTQYVHIVADYGKLLQGVNFKTQATSNPWNNLPVIQSIAANIPNMFRYEY